MIINKLYSLKEFFIINKDNNIFFTYPNISTLKSKISFSIKLTEVI